ncbi:MAG TPA: PQQ-binding-like beta-propeller repeat protein [Pirellulaceae bacterium]|nr:PQQ-binding-like beta-propeller repeat protein [Pirellulaceae bacterium]
MKRLTAVLLVGFLLATSAGADNWPSWRGPNYDGVAPGKGYATTWSATENVRWKVALPGPGSSTPILWGDHIFLTCASDGHNTAVCLSRDGKLVWKTPIGQRARSGKNAKATGSNPSAVTDGEHIWVYFKSGALACLDMQGKIVWETNLQDEYGTDSLQWDLGTSPVLTRDAVVVAVMHRPPSYLVAFEKETGKVAWKQDRTLPAPAEANDSYSTPIVLAHEGRELLVVLGADHVTGHDAASGKELWRAGGLNPRQAGNFRSIASAVIEDGVVVAPYARGGTLTAIKLGGSGDVTKSHVVWTRDDLGADVPTPAALEGKVYVCGDRGQVSCLDVKTGDTIWTGTVERHRTAYSSSPVIADGKLYVTREDGATFVLALGDEFKLLAKNEIGREQVVATPVFADGLIFLRTRDNLYCIGK